MSISIGRIFKDSKMYRNLKKSRKQKIEFFKILNFLILRGYPYACYYILKKFS